MDRRVGPRSGGFGGRGDDCGHLRVPEHMSSRVGQGRLSTVRAAKEPWGLPPSLTGALYDRSRFRQVPEWLASARRAGLNEEVEKLLGTAEGVEP